MNFTDLRKDYIRIYDLEAYIQQAKPTGYSHFSWKLDKGDIFVVHLLVPVTDRTAATASNLLFNFYPIPSTGLAAITTGLPVTDTNFFATV